MMKTTPLVVFVLAALLASCDPGSESAFTAGRSLVPCLQNIPVCPDFFARCEMNSTTYAQVRFPDDSPFAFLVSALPREKIEVSLYWVTQNDAGLDTRILWYEPGCSDVYKYTSDGLNLFEDTEHTNDIFTVDETVFEGGDHPIEINSDMRGIVDIAVRVLVPGSS
jgi:hypothetical protein